ncbi:MAG: hypothetical protein AAFV98_03515 [Chloroflexota bacterium]
MPKRPYLNYTLILLGYFALAVLIVGHPPQTLLTHFIGSDTGDTYEMARNVWWFTYALQNGEPVFYQTWLGYPDGINGIVLLSLPLQYFPMWGFAFFMPLQVAYNLTVLLWMTLNGFAMFWLARDRLSHTEITQPFVPALFAGMVYLLFPVLQAHLAEGHGGLMVAWAAPLYVYALFRYTETDTFSRQWLVLCVLYFYLTTTGHILQSIYVLVPVTLAFGLGKLWQRDWRSIQRIVIMGALASVVVLLALFPAIQDALTATNITSTGGYTRFSADLLAVVSPSFFHPLWDSLLGYPRAVLGTNLVEGIAYIGLIGGILAIIALVKIRPSRWWLLLAFIAWLLSLGPILKIFDQPVLIAGNTIPLPFALLQDLPGFNLARTPGRFSFTLAIAVAMLVGYGVSYLWQKIADARLRYIVVIVIACLTVFDYQSFWSQPLRPATVPQAIADLRDDDSIQAVFNIPYQHALAAKDALYYQTAHQHPLIAGQITRTTPVNPAKLALLQVTLDPALLTQAGADIVILHRRRAASIGELDSLTARANAQFGAPVYSDDEIAIYRVPETPSDVLTLDYTLDRSAISFVDDFTLLTNEIFYWEDTHYIWLQWQFNRARPDSDVRFVHILNAEGEIVLQSDMSLGTIPDGEIRNELLPFDTSTLPSGTYTVRTGWYDFNTLTNYLTTDNQATVIIGTFTISD